MAGLAVACDGGSSKASAVQSAEASSVGAVSSASASASVTASASASAVVSASVSAVAPAIEYESEDLVEADVVDKTLEDQRATMIRRMVGMGITDAKGGDTLATILSGNHRMGQGNPDVVKHPMTRRECIDARKKANVHDEKKSVCGGPFMVPVWDSAIDKEQDAKVCIDRYEFPGLPCDYPMTWTSTNQAQELCHAVGKRLCDAHEWEGACAGSVHAPDKEYAFLRPRSTMRNMHNNDREIRWAYGFTKDHGKCATKSHKSKTCKASGWRECGSNTYPAGSFPECKSPFGVYDQHGNAAEHMALPLREDQLGSKGGFGVPEMKGSWFIFSSVQAHIDDCRWRAPAWHDNEGKNHSNYHLGFRCCKDIKP